MSTQNSLAIGCACGILLLACAGCESSESDSPPVSMSEMAARMEAARPAEPPVAVTEPMVELPAEEPQVVTAKTPTRGKTLHDQGSYLSAVGSARFRTEHQMILNQVHHALNLYQAEHGEFPKTHDEFMKRIIEPNSIALPELDQGYEYWYDPSERSPADMLKFRPIQDGAEE